MKKISITFLSLLLFYVLSLAIIYSLPNFKLSENVEHARQTLKEEGTYRTISQSFQPQTTLDNFTDLKVMVPRSINDNNALVSAMDMKGYSRYWHGYQVILKPLLSIFTYEQVRFIYNIIIMVLFSICCSMLWCNVSKTSAIALAISLCFAHIEIIGMSIQFSNAFILTFISIIYLLSKKDIDCFLSKNIILFFFTIGSLINFIDLLTAPVITLGLPLAIVILTKKRATISNIMIIIKSSIAWGIGYGLTWASKWCIGSLILNKNIISDAIHQIFFRSIGDETHPIHRSAMLAYNFKAMFISSAMAYIIPAIFLIAIVLYRKINIGITSALLLLSLMPYVWYVVLTNHSQIHFWFTFRAQTVTMFCFLIMLSLIIKYFFFKKDES
ncbi:MAG: hypothetical protein ACRCZW_04805 [Lactobacillaceae bacterium]